ncbi:MAG: polyphosphate kinase 1 [Candidatus Omnitrophota bacterium]
MAYPPEARYFDRELSWIAFNARVLDEAMQESNPLLERLKFLGIVSSNFDEFFMVRAASLEGSGAALAEIYEKAFAVMRQQNEYFMQTLGPQLEKEGIRRIPVQGLSEEQKNHVQRFFRQELSPLLTPIALRDEHPLPDLVNLSLYSLVVLFKQDSPAVKYYALIEIPKNFSRFVSVPAENGFNFVLIEDVLPLFLKELFGGWEVERSGLFRITRAAELSLDEEKDEDFSKTMTEALRARRRSLILRLETNAQEEDVRYFAERFAIPAEKIFRVPGWMDLSGISKLAFRPMYENLKLPVWIPNPIVELEDEEGPWGTLREKSLLVYHPYQTFDAFLHFLRSAAQDPDVLAIKQTLYRTAYPSEVIRCLETAAENGKQVTVLVEIKARFDERRNIEWANRLVNAGATVLYGVAGLKTHAKACLVIRREADGIRRYVHLSTGNYNERTSRVYSDIGFFTAEEALTADISAFFNIATGFSQPIGFSKIEMAPYGLRRRLLRMIHREALRSRKEEPGLILAKMNSLVDPELIEAFYKASQAGVRIRLNVRGICCLRPGVPSMSENIEVTSIVDMFLEHARIFYFQNGKDEEIYLSSADGMPRNLDRRLELFFPVEAPSLKKELKGVLEAYFRDNGKAWTLDAQGDYVRRIPGPEKSFRVQEFLCHKFTAQESVRRAEVLKSLKPQNAKSHIRTVLPDRS